MSDRTLSCTDLCRIANEAVLDFLTEREGTATIQLRHRHRGGQNQIGHN